jgi:hypothetical protein
MLGSGHGHAKQIHPHHVHAASRMTECANRFLAALDPNQRGKATVPFESGERLNWHFIPKERKGLPLREMAPYQKHLASALLAAGLSQTGYIKAVTIMSLEDVLKIIENDNGERRNPEKLCLPEIRSSPRVEGILPNEPQRSMGLRTLLESGEPNSL